MAVRAQTHKLGRERDQRRALLKAQATSLVLQESIVTTRAKAKALQPYIEKLITKAQQDTPARRRLLASRVSGKEALTKLFDVLAPRYSDRPGGYTRLQPHGFRRGDNAPLTKIAFVAEGNSADTTNSESAADGLPATDEQETVASTRKRKESS